MPTKPGNLAKAIILLRAEIGREIIKESLAEAGQADPMAALVALVTKSIAEAPHQHLGHDWCAMAQPDMAKALGVSVSTLGRRIKTPPIVRDTVKRPDGGKVTLLRVGEVNAETARRMVQKRMGKIWDAKTGKKHTPKAFGCFAGLIDHWGLDLAPDMLALVLAEWPAFMAGVHNYVAEHGGEKRFWDHPTATAILLFHHVGAELWDMTQQDQHGMEAHYAPKAPMTTPAPSPIA